MTAFAMIALAGLFAAGEALRPFAPEPPPSPLASSKSAFHRAAAQQPIEWEVDPVAAIARSRRTGRPLFVFVGAPGSPSRREIDRSLFAGDAAWLLNRRFVCLRIDGDAMPEWQSAALPLSSPSQPMRAAWALSIWSPRGRLLALRLDAADRGAFSQPELEALAKSAEEDVWELSDQHEREEMIVKSPSGTAAALDPQSLVGPGSSEILAVGVTQVARWELQTTYGSADEAEEGIAMALESGYLGGSEGIPQLGWSARGLSAPPGWSRMTTAAAWLSMTSRMAARTGKTQWIEVARLAGGRLAKSDGMFWCTSPQGREAPDHAERGGLLGAGALIEAGLMLDEPRFVRVGLRRIQSLWRGRQAPTRLGQALDWAEACLWAYAATGDEAWLPRLEIALAQARQIGKGDLPGEWWSRRPVRAADNALPIQIRAMDTWEESDATRLVRVLARASVSLSRPALMQESREAAQRVAGWAQGSTAPAWASFARDSWPVLQGRVVRVEAGGGGAQAALRANPTALAAWGPPPALSDRS